MENQIKNLELKVRRDIEWAELTEKYLQHLAVEIESITELVELGNLNSVKKQANSLKHSAFTYQLRQIAEYIEKLEQSANNQSTEDILIAIDDVIKAITAEIEHLDNEIKQQLEESFFQE